MNISEALNLSDIERAARASMPKGHWAYLSGGAGSEASVRGNIAAFSTVRLVPRIPVENCSAPTITRLQFGRLLAMPILLAPTSPQRLFHAEAELASARAAAASGTISIVSTDCHFDLCDISTAAAGAWWFQLYAYRSRADVERTIRIAEEARAEALVVTMDAHFPARRLSSVRAGFVAPSDVDFSILRRLQILTGPIPPNARIERLPLTWDDLSWIRRCTQLPILVKGVLHPEDARRAVEMGFDGIIVSNHGGRQLDEVEASLSALQIIAEQVPRSCVLLLDGGIRSGIDVAKALAVGASAVCVGRPYLWGLYLAGEQGVTTVLSLLANELRDALRQLGAARIDDIGREFLGTALQDTGEHKQVERKVQSHG
jgi:4-hydroxymandelate oxidase